MASCYNGTRMKNIVVIGGGSGSFNVLKGLKRHPVHITAIVTVFDSGGSTGVLRDEFGILPPGDIRRCLVALAPPAAGRALSDGDSTLRDLFSFRFEATSSLHGHSFGNLFLQALADIEGDDVRAIQKAGKLLNITGDVLPVSTKTATVCAQLATGRIIRGENNIDTPKHNGATRITRVFLNPVPSLFIEARRAIGNADLIVIGPGDLYTSILPNLLVRGFADAVRASRAPVVYVTNIMTKWGETNGRTASECAREVLSYLKKEKFEYIVCNSGVLQPALVKKYKRERAEPTPIDHSDLRLYADRVICRDVLSQSDVVRHDSAKLARVLVSLVRQGKAGKK